MGRSKLIKYIDKKTFKGIRDSLGMTQEDMAAYLNVNRSQLNMAERNQRELPREALLKFGELEKFMAAVSSQTLAENEKLAQSLNEQKQYLKAIATKRIRDCSHGVHLAENALEILQVKKNNARICLQYCHS